MSGEREARRVRVHHAALLGSWDCEDGVCVYKLHPHERKPLMRAWKRLRRGYNVATACGWATTAAPAHMVCWEAYLSIRLRQLLCQHSAYAK